MTFIQKSWLKITAPPGGNRKCLVFCMSYTWTYSSSSTDRNHVKLSKGSKDIDNVPPPPYHSYGFKEWAWQNNWIAPPKVQPRHYDWPTCTKIDRAMFLFITNKKVSWIDMLDKTGSGHFDHFRHFYFAKLVRGISSDQRQLLWMSSQQDGDINYLSIFYSHHMVWPWRGIEFWWSAKKERFITTPLCIVLSASNLIHTFTVLPWSDPWVNIDSSLQRHPLAIGSDMFYTLMHSSGCFTIYISNELKQVIGPWSELWHFLKPCKHWGAAKVHPSPKETMLS